MRNKMDWTNEPTGSEALLSALGSAMVRFALLFSTAGVALALFLTPMLERDTRQTAFRAADLDTMSTGSVPPSGSYTVRRSVLAPGAVCVIPEGATTRPPNC
jgi:hypothetical protein